MSIRTQLTSFKLFAVEWIVTSLRYCQAITAIPILIYKEEIGRHEFGLIPHHTSQLVFSIKIPSRLNDLVDFPHSVKAHWRKWSCSRAHQLSALLLH